MSNPKLHFVKEYFSQLRSDISRAEALLESDEYLLEGLLVLACYIGAFARVRYPQEPKDWKSYKTIVWEYGGKKELYGQIDLLFFYQWPKSTMANESPYKCFKNHSDISAIFQEQFGNEEDIKNNAKRYQSREALTALIKELKPSWFDENNFSTKVELFSNNQILYKFLRCEAVHNADFPLLNRTWCAEQGRITYEENHRITPRVVRETVRNIHSDMEKECLAQSKWPWEI